MAHRAELELRAAAVNVDTSTYPNDSKLEQAVIYAEKAVTATSSATQRTPSAFNVARISGGQNV
jgi:hypothetical protein